jgi:hypothetical protein
MSKRGSSNALRFAGKVWKLNKPSNSPVKTIDTTEKKRRKVEKKAQKRKIQFEVLLKNFPDDKTIKIEILFNKFEREFSNSMRSHSVRFCKKFKLKSDNELMSIQEYLTTKPWKSIKREPISYFRTKFIDLIEKDPSKLL